MKLEFHSSSLPDHRYHKALNDLNLEDILPDTFINDLHLLELSENGKENKSPGSFFSRLSSAHMSHLWACLILGKIKIFKLLEMRPTLYNVSFA